MNEPQEPPKYEHDGLGMAAGIVGAGLVCLWAPTYLDATDGWHLVWLVVAAFFGLVGLGGALQELAKLTRQDAFGDWSATLILFGMAGVLYVLEDRGSVEGRWATATKVAVILLAFWVPIGFFRGLVRYATAAPRPKVARPVAQPRLTTVVTSLTAVAGLGTAVVGFLRALEG